MTGVTGVTIRVFHYIILAVYVSCCCCNFIYAESSVLYILPNDHLSNNVNGSCPQNKCHTLNEWVESDLNLELITNEIDTIVLLPGVHVINTTGPGANLYIEDIGLIVITSDGEASIWCMSRFMFDFFNGEWIEISNIAFKSRGSMIYLMMHVYCTLSSSTLLYLQNCTMYKANIHMNAQCTQVDVQQITISHLRLESKSIVSDIDYFGRHSTFSIYHTLKVSLEDISIEDNTTPLSMLEIFQYYIVELKGHILFHGN